MDNEYFSISGYEDKTKKYHRDLINVHPMCSYKAKPPLYIVDILKPKIVNPSNEVASHQLLNKNGHLSYVC